MTSSSSPTRPASIVRRRWPGNLVIGLPSVDRLLRGAVHRRLETLHCGSLDLTTSAGERIRFGNAAAGERAASIEIHDDRFYRAVALRGGLGAADSFIRGDWSSADLAHLLRLFARSVDANDAVESGLARLLVPFERMGHMIRRNTKAGSRRNIVAHYDLGNEFFALFLDPTMTYSCGVFERADSTMEEASIAKLDGLCRKLDLQPTDHVLEIGTGWGSFAMHAAATYGCRVTTTTISEKQHTLATERVRAARLDDRVTVVLRDYRDLEGRFDKLVSIEMIEAVGHANLGTYFEAIARLLKPGGLCALQAITMPGDRYEQYRRTPDFIQQYVFPGSCCPSLQAMTAAMARTPLSVLQLEDITPHYAETLRRWRRRFFDRIEEVRALGCDDTFIRLWDYYLSYCEAGFAESYIRTVQMVIGAPGAVSQPTRLETDGAEA